MTDDLSPDDDDRLTRLYRETDDDAEPPGEWSSLRAMIGAARESGFDEEPPARIDALLMAAARQHAPAPRLRWWQRLAAWMKPAMMHPAMAGALALVVVVGVAGVMYRRGDRQVAQPPPPPIAPPTEVARAPQAAGPMPPAVAEPTVGAGEFRGDGAEAPGGPPAAVPPVARPPAVTLGDVDRGDAPKRPPADERKPGAGATAGGALGGADPSGTRGPSTTIATEAAEEGEADDATAIRDGVVRPADTTASPPPPPPPPPPGTKAPVPERQATTAADKVPSLGDLLRQAQVAAGARDCVKVRAVSAQVLARDPAYHRDVFAKDRAIAPCLAAQIGY
ncbi:MAG: hypothetical protein JNK64_26870 [Myxococcales bacterium]|nr:hypothetical protein [Myxococcales bacterium]